MEAEQALTDLRSTVDGIEADLGSRLAFLEQRMAALERIAGLPSWQTQAPPPPPSPHHPPPHPAPDTATTASTRRPVPGAPPPTGPSLPQSPAAEPAASSGTGMPPPPTGSPVGPPPPRPARTPTFEVGVEALLRWAGVALVVLSAVFLVSTAISRGWIGPELQLLGATAIGFGLLAAAIRLAVDHRRYALACGNGGAVVVIICAGAAYSWLDLYSALTALILVAVAAAISVGVAARLGMQSVAVVSTAAMLIVPTLAEILTDGPVLATGIWLGLFAIAATAVGLARRWVLYRLVSTWSTAVWVLGLAGVLYDDGNTDHVAAGIALVAVVGLTLWLHPLFADRRLNLDRSAQGASAPVETAWATLLTGLEHRSAVLLPLWAWGSALLFAGLDADDPGGWIGLLMAGGFVALAMLAGPIERSISGASLGSHLLGAGLLVTVSAVAWIGGPLLPVVIAGQAVTTLVLAQTFSDRWLKVNAYLLAGLAWLMLAVDLAESIDLGPPTAREHLAHGVVVALLAALAWLTDRSEQRSFVEVVYGLVWLAGVGLTASLVDPLVADRVWLVVGVVVTIAGLVAARRLGLYVLGTSLAIGLATVAGSVVSIIDAAESGTDVVGHLANLTVVAALAGGTYLLWVIEERMELARPMLIAAWLGVLGWLASVLLAAPQGQVAVSVSWAVAACVALIAGVLTNEAVVRVLGLGTLAAVLTKLMTVDLAEVDTLWRVGLFLLIGLGLLRLGYILPALAERYGPESPPPPGPDVMSPGAAPPDVSAP